MKISIFGLGYVGAVSAACLARDGHSVIGVDVNREKLALFQAGCSPIVEPGLDELVEQAVNAERLIVTADPAEAIRHSDLTLVCVGTPSHSNGSLCLDHVKRVSAQIGAALADKPLYHVVVIRSTVLPTTVEQILLPILEEYSGKKAGRDFGLAMHPEFLREGTAIADYTDPNYVVIGELDERSGDRVEELYPSVNAPLIRTAIRTAEMVKYTSNAFHALKIVFANEIGNLCKAHQVDGQDLMEIFIQDQQLNISSAYLRPGFAFGGSCLPKDMRALLYRAKELDLECPTLAAVLPSNQKQVERAIRFVEEMGKPRIGVLGLSFKEGTDDVRESPVITLVETLVGRGYQVEIFDEKIEVARMMGANKFWMDKELPHLASLLRPSLDEVVQRADVVVVTNGSPAFRPVRRLLRNDQTLLDLVGIAKTESPGQGMYEGICWA